MGSKHGVYIICIVIVVVAFGQYYNLRSLRKEAVDEDYSSSPTMYTFYQSAPGGEEDLLKAWEDAWQEKGFQTKILTLEDAKNHPDFYNYKKIIEESAWDSYNEMCFYRWLAMAATGQGGWMSDYDTFPLNFPIEDGINLPNNGQFTSYESFVPSLLSGSDAEWNKVSKLVIDAIGVIPEGVPKSDMFAFREVRNQGDNRVIFLTPGTALRAGYDYEEPHKINCAAMKYARAVHLSHSESASAFNDGLYPIEIPNEREQYRGDASKVYLKEWNDQCSNFA